MQSSTSPRKKLKSPLQDVIINPKTSITCSNVPDSLFDATAAKKHFSKFGRVQKIRLFPKRHMCIIEYDQPSSSERAVLNAGAYDGFMFDVTRSKMRVRRRSSRKDDDPDWVPDSDVEEELSAMGGTPTYRVTRKKSMDVEPEPKTPPSKLKIQARPVKQVPLKKKVPIREKKMAVAQPASVIEAPVAVVTTQTTLTTAEAATELHQLRSKVSLSPDEQWRILEARDKILRAWGGAGSRIKEGGATIGTCQDMCPEKELLHRQAEHQVMTLETVLDSDGELEPWRAVKQYSRSSADQEIPMCYELRPPPVLMRTCAYLLHEIADTKRQVSLADWFHFMWDRFRGIRKDITQQALCCAESICLVEMCARFHAHCAARLADLEHTQFDQKLNTDNLTKCLQTLKHMYADVGPEQKPREAEFRGYVALLNLGDANFWWEIKQLPIDIQKSRPIIFAIKVFNAIDNNNYVRFFRLVREEANYLQACILLRYFNDVRARALARIVKAYAPRGGSRYPAEEMMNSLAFETIENLKSFINHYGLRLARTEDCDGEVTIILDRNQFIEDSDPYPIARAINLIESKRHLTVGEIIAGGQLPDAEYSRHVLYSSFKSDGRLKESALTADEQGYNTLNDSNKDINELRAEIQRLSQGGRTSYVIEKAPESKVNVFAKPDVLTSSPKQVHKFSGPAIPPPTNIFKAPTTSSETNLFLFKPAITVAPTDIIKNSPEKMFNDDSKKIFSFSKPQETAVSNLFTGKETVKRLFESNAVPENNKIFGKNKDKAQNLPLFKGLKSEDNLFKKPEGNVFAQPISTKPSTNLFTSTMPKNVFATKEEKTTDTQPLFPNKSIFAGAKTDIFSKPDSTAAFEKGGSIFAKPAPPSGSEDKHPSPSTIFGSFAKQPEVTNVFAKAGNAEEQIKSQSVFANGEATSKLSPGSLFKSAIIPPNGSDARSYSIFQSKNKAQTVADNILNSIATTESPTVYEFNQNEAEEQKQAEIQRLNAERMRQEEERQMQEKIKREEEIRKQEMRRQEEERRKEEARKKQEEARKKQEELRLQEEKRKKEEQRVQEELKKKIEEEKKAEEKRKAEEERKFRERVDRESADLVEELTSEVNDSTVKSILQEELQQFNSLMQFANTVADEIMLNLSNEILESELKAEIFLTRRLMKKWFHVWRKQYIRNVKRRNLLEDTPVWLTRKTPLEEALYLRRFVENATLKNMNAVHKGYKFIGELRQLPTPEPYNIMEIIRSPLLKRMKQISYPYDKCFFWKITLVSPGAMKWLHKKINIEKWILDVFSDRKQHEASNTLIHVGKYSWNHLMDFAISVSLTGKDMNINEAIEGANAVLFYATEYDTDVVETIEATVKHKYPYQIVPVAVIIPKVEHLQKRLEVLLSNLLQANVISEYKIYLIEPQDVYESLNTSSKSAMKWLAKKFPQTPPLEIDYLKSICQRYLGNEIWCRLRLENDTRMNAVIRDLYKLIMCYNAAVDNLTKVITNEDLFNYSLFPLEFQPYLDSTSPYPKPYEFIPSSAKTSDNVLAIKRIMSQLKLPDPTLNFNPVNAISLQEQMSSYCNQIGWFENPEEVLCRVVAVLPKELSNISMPCEDFNKYFAHYNLVDFMNIIVYEKISRLNNFENRFAVYEKSVLEDYRNALWLHEVKVINEMKHKALDYEDDIDFYVEAKRRKIEIDSLDYLMLEDKDRTLVDESIKEKDVNISKYKNCADAVKQLEKQIEEEKQKSLEFENLLRAALGNN